MSTPVKLPGLAAPATGNAALDAWARSVTEILQVREGARGDKLEQVVTKRDLAGMGLDTTQWSVTTGAKAGEVVVKTSGGGFGTMTASDFAESIRNSKLYADLMRSINDASRFDNVPAKVRALVLQSLADEAALRSAAVTTLTEKIQSEVESLAYTVTETTAALHGSVAGVREAVYAAADDGRATAGHVTQLTAALDGTGSATIEESMTVIADRTAGLRSQYMLKLAAGNAVAGVGLMASEDPGGTTTSAFIVEADQFALVAPINFSQEATPSATVIGQTWYTPSTKVYKRATATGTGSWVTFTPTAPFGVNTATGQTFINGTLTINSGGGLLQDSTAGADGDSVDIVFVRAASQPATPTASAGAPTAPITWYSNVSSVPAGANPLWSSVGKKVSPATTYTWGTPVKVDGTAVAEVTAYVRSASAPATPTTGGTYTFSATPVFVAPTAPIAWSTAIPAGTNPVYTSRAVVSAPSGYTSAVSITGWTTPVLSMQNGTTGDPGVTGTRGTITTKISGAWNSTTAAAAVSAIATAAGSTPTTPIKGDIVYYTGGAQECSVAGNPGTWGAVAAFIDGSLVVTGSVSADRIGAGSITTATLDTSGYGKFAGQSGVLAAGIGNVEATVYSSAASASVGNNIRAGVVGYATSPSNAVKWNLGVCGYATGTNSIGAYAQGALYGLYAVGTTSVYANASTVGVESAGAGTAFYASSGVGVSLNAAGTIAAAKQITSTLATGTAPLSVSSTTVCPNLSATYASSAGSATTAASCSGNANTATTATTAVTGNNALALGGVAPAQYPALINGTAQTTSYTNITHRAAFNVGGATYWFYFSVYP